MSRTAGTRRPPGNAGHWTLTGLVRCAYCREAMLPSQVPGGPRTYRCPPPCGRGHVEARSLEEMAHQVALNALPGLAGLNGRVSRPALFAEMFRQLIVHDDTGDVRFVGHAH